MKNYNERTCSFCKQEFETITVNSIESSNIIQTRKPLGKFIHIYQNGIVSAIDNEDGNAWTEDFTTRARAVSWLFQE